MPNQWPGNDANGEMGGPSDMRGAFSAPGPHPGYASRHDAFHAYGQHLGMSGHPDTRGGSYGNNGCNCSHCLQARGGGGGGGGMHVTAVNNLYGGMWGVGPPANY
jgi:hypothetical protein